MSKKFLLNWALWIGVWSGLYVFAYVLSPLNEYGMLPATFISLPIYFLSGAKKAEFVDYASSAIIGVLWGMFYLLCIGELIALGLSGAVSQGLVVGVLTVILCGLHFILPIPVFTKVPMIFGAIAFTFITGASQPVAAMITFVLGISLAFLCNFGSRFLDADGNWTFTASQAQ